MSTAKPCKRGTGDIVAAIRKRFPSNAYAVAFEVGNATGFKCSRHADAIIVSLWPSRGIGITGCEFKASRSDWLKELQDPAKADPIMRYCDRWYLVVTDEDIVKPGELPETWGLMACSGATLRTVREATKIDAMPVTIEFFAAFARAVADPVSKLDDNAMRQAEWRGREQANEESKKVHEKLQEKITSLQKSIIDFENHTGVSINDRWRGIGPDDLKKALRVLAEGHEPLEARIRELHRMSIDLARDIGRHILGLESIRNVTKEVT